MDIDYRGYREVMPITATQFNQVTSEVTIDQLNLQHPDYTQNIGVWQTIHELIQSKPAMRYFRHKYLIRRVGEPDELYQKRLEAFVMTPVLAESVRDITKKLRSGQLNIDVDDSVLQAALTRYDSLDFASELMGSWVKFGVVWVAVDADKDGIPVPRILSPLNVINWGESEGLDWVVVRTYETRTRLFRQAEQVTVWTITESDRVRRYESVDGSAPSLVNDYPLKYPGICPMFRSICKPELWTASAAYLKQMQHILIENALTDTATNLYLQRVIKPKSTPDDDLDDSYLNSTQDGGLYTSNAHIIEGDFSFAEASGTSVTVNMALLERIETQIKALIAMGAINGQSRVESGESKSYDYSDYRDTIAEYGHNIVAAYRELLTLMLRLTGGNTAKIEVTGLDTFEMSNLDTMLVQSEAINLVESKLSELALKQWYTKVSLQLAGSVPESIKEAIRREVEAKTYGEVEEVVKGVIPPNTRSADAHGSQQVKNE